MLLIKSRCKGKNYLNIYKDSQTTCYESSVQWYEMVVSFPLE